MGQSLAQSGTFICNIDQLSVGTHFFHAVTYAEQAPRFFD